MNTHNTQHIKIKIPSIESRFDKSSQTNILQMLDSSEIRVGNIFMIFGIARY